MGGEGVGKVMMCFDDAGDGEGTRGGDGGGGGGEKGQRRRS